MVGWKPIYLFQLLKTSNDDISSSEEQYFSKCGFPPPVSESPETAIKKADFWAVSQFFCVRILQPVTMESAFLASTLVIPMHTKIWEPLPLSKISLICWRTIPDLQLPSSCSPSGSKIQVLINILYQYITLLA